MEGIRKNREIGFDTIDIFADPLDIGIRERRLIMDTRGSEGLPVISVCCVALGIADFNLPVRRFHLDRCRAYLDFAMNWRRGICCSFSASTSGNRK